MGKSRLLPLLLPLLFLLMFGAAMVWIVEHAGGTPESRMMRIAFPIAHGLTWLALGWVISKLMDVFVWRAMVEAHTGRPAPRLIVEVVRIIVLLLVIAAIVTFVFERPITGLLVSSGVIGIVLGFALQRMIMDFFSGIALSVEGPFHVGQWIQVDDVAGRVVQVSWRATHVVTLEQTTVIIPNSLIAEKMVTNYELPGGFFRTELPVELEYGVPVTEARRVLLGAVVASAGVLDTPAADVIVASLTERGVQYRCRFYIRSYRDLNHVTDRVATNISEHMFRAGMSVPYPKRDVFYAPMPAREIDREAQRGVLLKRSDLFGALDEAEVSQIADELTERHFLADEDVVRQGDEGSSMFVVVDGLLNVFVKSAGVEQKVAQLEPGDMFGEMSLLTGAPRAATVRVATACTLYEIRQATFARILERRPELAQQLSEVIAARQRGVDEGMRSAEAAARASEHHAETFAEHLRHSIQRFFHLRPRDDQSE